MSSALVQPTPLSGRPFGQNYAFVVVAVIFLALLSSAGLRATPGVLMPPLQAFMIAGATGIVAAVLSLMIARHTPQPTLAAA
jgi:hypothetical protein